MDADIAIAPAPPLAAGSVRAARVPVARPFLAPRGDVATALRGHELIAQPLLNKGTAFTDRERAAFGLQGLLPAAVATIDDQVALELEHVRRKTDDLERYIGLAALQDRNETLFYRLLVGNLEEFLPIVYTPTVGNACQEFSHIFRRPRGIWITPDDVHDVDGILRTAGVDARLIVVTDNERILGLGDQGAGGIAIPVGKLVLYSAAAGIHPSATLPVSLDVGTDRQELLDDPLYVGYRARRLRGAAYDAVVDAFVAGVERVFPDALIQWEDFKQHNAIRLLDRYRTRIASFNDDIQGTGAVVLAGLLAARRERGGLGGDRFLLMGAGAAAIGIARAIVLELVASGEPPDAARGRIALLDRRGLVQRDRSDLPDDQRPYAVDVAALPDVAALTDASDPVAVARAHRATVLIGATGCGGAFSEALVRAVAANDVAPIVLPLSNPTSCAEASPADILAWTDGRALVATGSPNRTVDGPTGPRSIGQANNVFIFPGVGLGAIVGGADEVTDEMFRIAAHRLAGCVTAERLAVGALFPPIGQLRSVAREVAIAVARHSLGSEAAWMQAHRSVEDLVDDAMWSPEYLPLVPAE
jgi:malic enzyme